MKSIAVTLLAALTVILVVGCGGGGGNGIGAAQKRVDSTEGRYLLAEVELDRAWYRRAEAGQKERPYRTFHDEMTDLSEARRVLKQCIEGDGLESCTEVEPIREIVDELNRSPRYGG